MLLRRISQHFKTQNWFAVGLDFFIVVVGVFVGLQAQEWANGRVQRANEVQVLRALAEDLEGGVQILDGLLMQLREEGAARRELARYANDVDARLPAAELDRLIFLGLYRLSEETIPQPAMEELTASGRLSQLGSSALRRRLSELDVALADLAIQYADVRQTFYAFSDPFLIQHYDLRGILRDRPEPSNAAVAAWFDRRENRSDFNSLKSREFINILIYREAIGAGVFSEVESIRATYVDLIGLIDARLAELGAPRTEA